MKEYKLSVIRNEEIYFPLLDKKFNFDFIIADKEGAFLSFGLLDKNNQFDERGFAWGFQNEFLKPLFDFSFELNSSNNLCWPSKYPQQIKIVTNIIFLVKNDKIFMTYTNAINPYTEKLSSIEDLIDILEKQLNNNIEFSHFIVLNDEENFIKQNKKKILELKLGEKSKSLTREMREKYLHAIMPTFNYMHDLTQLKRKDIVSLLIQGYIPEIFEYGDFITHKNRLVNKYAFNLELEDFYNGEYVEIDKRIDEIIKIHPSGVVQYPLNNINIQI